MLRCVAMTNDSESGSDVDARLVFSLQTLLMAWRWWLAGICAGIFLAVLLFLCMQPQYEAVALLQMGRIGKVGEQGLMIPVSQISQHTQLEQSALIESPANALERMQSAGFRQELASRILEGHPEYSLDEVMRGLSDTRIWNLRSSVDLVRLAVRAGSPEEARRRAGIYADLLIQRHQELAKEPLALQQAQLADARARLAEMERQDAVRNPELQKQRDGEKAYWRENVFSLQMLMTRPATRPTALLEPVFAQQKPVSPRPVPLLMFGALAGFFLGLSAYALSCLRRR